MTRLAVFGVTLAVWLSGCATAISTQSQLDAHFERLRGDPQQLAGFMRAMPKGGDLHHHLIGAPTAQMFIDIAIEDGFCMDPATLAASPGPCIDPARPVAEVVAQADNHERLVKLWSMQGFGPGDDAAAAHFFGIFPLIWPVVDDRGHVLARLRRAAASEHIAYLETQLQVPAATDGIRQAALSADATQDVLQLREQLVANGELAHFAAIGSSALERYRETAEQRLGCAGPQPDPGCGVESRFQIYALRILPLPMYFADLILAFELAERSPWVVGVNVVGYEGDETALRDYAKGIDAIAALRKLYPSVQLSLHAGELTSREADAAALRNHVPLAFYTAGAERIGHGVTIRNSDDRDTLLADLRERGVVEINLTSNELLLGVAGDEHPLGMLWRAGVPTVLGTDDAGMFLTTLSREFTIAAQRYPWLRYADFKLLARRSLQHSFLPGASLFISAQLDTITADCAALDATQPSCAALLEASPRASLQMTLEKALVDFEQRVANGEY